MISVAIKTDSPYASDPQYYTYAIDVATGQNASKSDVLKAFGMSEDEFNTKIKSSVEKFFDNLHIRQKEYVGEDAYNEKLEKTISSSNLNKAKLYINEEGELCVIVGIYMFAGGENVAYKYCISLEKAEMQKDPMCEIHK